MKHIPMRKCLASNKMFPKNDLFRIVKTPTGEIKIDPTGKENGRGAYLAKDKVVIELAKSKKMLSRALECEVSDDIYEQLIKLL